MRRVAITLGLLLLASVVCGDAPATAPVPSPKPKPQAKAEALPPVDAPGFPQPDSPVPLAPIPEPTPTPKPPSPVQAANAQSFGVETQVGAMVVTTSASTDLTPTIWADAEGPLAYGNGKSIGRIGARIGLTASPDVAQGTLDLTNYKGVEVGLRLGRVVGVLGSVKTAVLGEYSFTTLIKGSTQSRPQSGLAHAAGFGLSFTARESAAGLTVLAGFDEATTTCGSTVICNGVHSGFAIIMYGQVPILNGKVLFAGDVSIAAGRSSGDTVRYSVERVYMAIDPVQLFKHEPTPVTIPIP